MKISFAVGMGRNERIDEIAELSRVAEESGFSYVTFVDQPIISRDVLVMLTIAGLNTRRIHIGQGVTDPETYPPLVIANSAATLGELTGGRFFVGIGVGGPFGKVMRPVSHDRFREAVEFIKRFTAGEEVQLNGQRVRSEFSRKQVRIYMGAAGPRGLQLAGELADGVVLTGGPTVVEKWRIEQIYKGAEKAGRDPAKIDIGVRAMIYVAESKEKARHEVAGFAAGPAVRITWLLQQKGPEIEELRRRLEREQPGLIEEFRKVHDVWDPSQHEKMDTKASHLVTQRVIDAVYLTGTVDDICEGIYDRAKVGVNTVATATYTIIDKKGMIREIGDKIMPNFRN